VKLTSADADSSISFQTTTSNNAEPNVRATIDKDGNFGIGTASPFSKTQITETGWSSGAPYGTVLTVTGNNTNDANWGHLIISDSSTGTGNGGMLRFAVGSTSSDISPHAGIDGFTEGSNYGGLKFLTRANGGTATERMRITSTGNVLIGTTVIDLSAKGFLLSANGVNMYQVQEGITSSTYHVYDTTNNNYKFYVGYNGTINATNTTISGLSDERLKENIRDLDKGLNDILKLKPRLFDWKEGEGSETKDVSGFVAQECEEAGFNEFVGNFKHKELDDAKSFGQGGLIPALVKAIQEQQTLIETLQAKVEALENG
jgi:hypothetical protein